MVEDPIDPRAIMWKDNNPTVLSIFSSVANAMCVQDTDIYVAGYESPTRFASNAVYWVNKQIVRLTFNSNSGSASAVGIGLVGKDVYVTGNLGGLAPLAVYWKNGDMALLPGTSPRVTGMVVKGNDVYICGSAGDAACYWKNAVLYRTDDNVLGSRATAITVDDNGDVYLCGSTLGTRTPRKTGYDRPAYWKNNALTVLPLDMLTATANGIAVDGNDQRGDIVNPKGVFWKNGTQEYLRNSLAGGCVATQGEVYVSGLRPIAPRTAYGIVFKDGAIIAQGSLTSFNKIYVIK